MYTCAYKICSLNQMLALPLFIFIGYCCKYSFMVTFLIGLDSYRYFYFLFFHLRGFFIGFSLCCQIIVPIYYLLLLLN